MGKQSMFPLWWYIGENVVFGVSIVARVSDVLMAVDGVPVPSFFFGQVAPKPLREI